MFFYAFYLIGSWAALALPRPFSYWLARRMGTVCYWRFSRDRRAVRRNLQQILGTENVSSRQVMEVFQNFGLYLLDFFRFQRLSPESVLRLVKVEGLERMQQALGSGRGVIGLTAHLGNFELAGAVLSLLGIPVSAVVLTHRNPLVNRFFERQRARVGVQAIPLTQSDRRAFFETALSVLRSNRLLALVGDRCFSARGLRLPFFGKSLEVPTGPAAFHLKTGAPIVPAFLVREANGGYRFFVEPPIQVPPGADREEAVRHLCRSCLEVMARYIRKYPTQWYFFHEFWKPGPSVIL